MRYAEAPETSAAQGLDHCNGCGLCCRVAPCLLLPADVPRLRKGLRMSVRRLQAVIQVERTPAGHWQVRMRDPCPMLAGNECTIHAFKPTGGRDFKCWTDNPQTYHWTRRDLKLVGFRA